MKSSGRARRAARLGRIGAPPLLHQLAVVPQREGRRRAASSAWRRSASTQWRELGGLGLQELAPRRRAEEELAHLDARAHAARGRAQLARSVRPGAALRGIGRAAGDAHVGHRRDGGQRLAAKAHRGDTLQVGQRGDLARGMPAQRQRELAGRDPMAVVLDDDRTDAAGHELDGDLGGAGVERVVDQLAHHRRRALHHLAGGDLAHQLVGQLTDRAARGRGQDSVHRGDSRSRR
jgi:hypothetical protein